MFRTRWTTVVLAITLAAGRPGAGAGQAAATSPTRLHANVGAPGSPAASSGLTARALNRAPTAAELAASAGPGVMHAQVLLDHAGFSVGVLDGQGGQNTEKAVRFFQQGHGLPATGTLDSATYAALTEAVGDLDGAQQITVTEALLRGPFVDVPNDPYVDAKLSCMCYVSALEELDERYHTTADVLRQLNPGKDLQHLTAGTTLWVPDVPAFDARAPQSPPPAKRIALIRVSKTGEYVQALAADGSIVYHFPTTLGSDYNPSPTGGYHIVSIEWDPRYHYDPSLLKESGRGRGDAMLPPGPNSPVGIVWIALTKEHVGIHGTPRPDLIGLDSSHGCVRLANWDAAKLASGVRTGVKVEFQ